MTLKRIKVGLCGLGRLGKLYAQYLAHTVPEIRLTAVADPDAARLAQVASETEARPYNDPLTMMDDKQVEAVVIVTPTVTHKTLIEAAAARSKPIFCEKPLSLTLAEAEAVRQIVEGSGIFFQMGFQRRYDKGFAEAKRKLEEGVIGRPVVFKSTSRDPYLPSLEYVHPKNSGGLLIDMAVHDFDVARWMMGEVKSIHALGATLVYKELDTIGDIDNAIVSLTFENKGLGVVDVTRNGLYGYDISADILGTEGTLRVGYLQETPLLVMKKNNVSHDTVPFFPERFGAAYVAQLGDFARNLLEDRPSPVTIGDGIAALRIAVAATRSYQTETTVEVASVQ